MQNEKNKWLDHQINAAKKNLEQRPDWMRRAARFEGSYSGKEISVALSSPTREKQSSHKKTSTKK